MADGHVYTFFELKHRQRQEDLKEKTDRQAGRDGQKGRQLWGNRHRHGHRRTYIHIKSENESRQGKIRLNTLENTMRQIINIRTQHGKET